jgi:hypothetical protein
MTADLCADPETCLVVAMFGEGKCFSEQLIRCQEFGGPKVLSNDALVRQTLLFEPTMWRY